LDPHLHFQDRLSEARDPSRADPTVQEPHRKFVTDCCAVHREDMPEATALEPYAVRTVDKVFGI
jgi:hypothetical protein